MRRPAAVLIAGPPPARAPWPRPWLPGWAPPCWIWDVATGPLTRVVSGLIGARDLDDPALAGLTRDARYDTLLGLADANLRAGLPVVPRPRSAGNGRSRPPGPPPHAGSRATRRWSGCTCPRRS